jgi:ferredoxin-NADP reductase
MDMVYRRRDPEVIMFYGNKDKDIIFKDTLDKLENNNDWLKIYYIMEPQFIDSDIIRKNINDLYNCFYFISGPLIMVQILKEMLLKMDIESKNIVEDYFPGYSDKK